MHVTPADMISLTSTSGRGFCYLLILIVYRYLSKESRKGSEETENCRYVTYITKIHVLHQAKDYPPGRKV